ncbi:unnamed protein product [Lactuca virosa]|uniref:Uncharacterized protein n=1 Tax=Lactuca virosa TaxID=75947 RepID=A0AAU9NVG8_9ASTR|nr:unnamed protein product [Lactuca virosa]
MLKSLDADSSMEVVTSFQTNNKKEDVYSTVKGSKPTDDVILIETNRERNIRKACESLVIQMIDKILSSFPAYEGNGIHLNPQMEAAKLGVDVDGDIPNEVQDIIVNCLKIPQHLLLVITSYIHRLKSLMTKEIEKIDNRADANMLRYKYENKRVMHDSSPDVNSPFPFQVYGNGKLGVDMPLKGTQNQLLERKLEVWEKEREASGLKARCCCILESTTISFHQPHKHCWSQWVASTGPDAVIAAEKNAELLTARAGARDPSAIPSICRVSAALQYPADVCVWLEVSDAGLALVLESMEFCLKLRGLEACVLEDLAKAINLVHIRRDLVESGHTLLNHAYHNQQEYERYEGGAGICDSDGIGIRDSDGIGICDTIPMSNKWSLILSEGGTRINDSDRIGISDSDGIRICDSILLRNKRNLIISEGGTRISDYDKIGINDSDGTKTLQKL